MRYIPLRTASDRGAVLKYRCMIVLTCPPDPAGHRSRRRRRPRPGLCLRSLGRCGSRGDFGRRREETVAPRCSPLVVGQLALSDLLLVVLPYVRRSPIVPGAGACARVSARRHRTKKSAFVIGLNHGVVKLQCGATIQHRQLQVLHTSHDISVSVARDEHTNTNMIIS